MSKIVNWGRWPVASYFGLQGIMSLSWLVTIIVFTLRDKSETFYPAYMGMFVCWVLVSCAWGVFKMRRWGYTLAMVVSALELLIGVVALVGTAPRLPERLFVHQNINFEASRIAILVVIPSLVLGWLVLPVVRTQYLQKEVPA